MNDAAIIDAGPFDVRVLGPFTLSRPGSVQAQPVPRGRLGDLLGVLALADGMPLSMTRLSALVWENPVEAVSSGSVQVAMSRLRAWLRDRIGVDVPIEFGPAGYALLAPHWMIDVRRFDELLAVGLDPARDGQERFDLLCKALDLWRGELLDGRGALDRSDPLLTRVERRRIEAACALAEVAVGAGESGVAADRLALVAKTTPLHEPLHAALILTLNAAGRRKEAVDAFHQIKRDLAEELGLDPGALLRNAYARLLREESRTPAVVQSSPTWRGPRPMPALLLGRDRELSYVATLVRVHQVTTVVGSGGCGKTAFALHVADRMLAEFPGGVGVAPLVAANNGTDALIHIGLALGLPDSNPDQLIAGLQETASAKRLLVIDNVEHLVDELAVIVSRLTAACSHLNILVTGRRALSIPAECVHSLGRLTLPQPDGPPDPDNPCLALFRERALTAYPKLQIGQDQLADVARICRRLDGLPLALELAAARVSALSVRQIADRLDQSMALLDATPIRSADGRQRTMQQTVEWSYQMLDPDSQTLFARLSAFRGDFPLDAAEAICALPPLTRNQIAAALVTLVDHSLVLTNPTRTHYRLLQPIADHAHRLLPQADRDVIQHRCVDHWRNRAHAYYHAAQGDTMEIGSELTLEIDNLRAAIDFGFSAGREEDASQTTADLRIYWLSQSERTADAEQWLQRAYAARERLPASLAAQITFEYGVLTSHWRSLATGATLLREALPMVQRSQSRQMLGQLYGRLAAVCGEQLDPAAMDYMRLEAKLVDETAEVMQHIGKTFVSTNVLTVWGRYEEVAPLAAEHRELTRQHFDAEAFTLYSSFLAEVAAAQGRSAEAIALVEHDWQLRHTSIPANQGDHLRRAYCAVLLEAGHLEAARDATETSITEMNQRYPIPGPRLPGLLITLAEIERRLASPQRARTLLQEAQRRALASAHYRRGMSGVLGTALVAHDLGDRRMAAELADSWNQLRLQIGLPVPFEYAAAAGATFAFDPAAPPGGVADSYTWDQQALCDLVERSQSWCAG